MLEESVKNHDFVGNLTKYHKKIQEIIVSFLKSYCWRAALNPLAGRGPLNYPQCGPQASLSLRPLQ